MSAQPYKKVDCYIIDDPYREPAFPFCSRSTTSVAKRWCAVCGRYACARQLAVEQREEDLRQWTARHPVPL